MGGREVRRRRRRRRRMRRRRRRMRVDGIAAEGEEGSGEGAWR